MWNNYPICGKDLEESRYSRILIANSKKYKIERVLDFDKFKSFDILKTYLMLS